MRTRDPWRGYYRGSWRRLEHELPVTPPFDAVPSLAGPGTWYYLSGRSLLEFMNNYSSSRIRVLAVEYTSLLKPAQSRGMHWEIHG